MVESDLCQNCFYFVPVEIAAVERSLVDLDEHTCYIHTPKGDAITINKREDLMNCILCTSGNQGIRM